MELQGSVVIVTGASSGIGAATARAFAQAGARVVLAARSSAPLDTLAQELGAERALAVPTDVTERAQVDALVRQAHERFGRIDILINNAGLGLSGSVATMDIEHLQRIFAVNVLGPILLTQAVVPHMRAAGGGLIVNVSSMVTRLTIPTIGGYRATKQALNAISDNTRIELGRDNIRVITVYPNVTATEFFANTLDSNDRADGFPPDRMRRAQPASHVARKIVEGTRAEPREVFMSRGDRVFAFVGTTLPRLIERVIGGRMQR